MKPMTKAQKRVLDCIRRLVEESDNQSPSYEEIAACAGIGSVSTIHVHVENLMRKGYLTKKWNANRSIELALGREPETIRELVPLAGTIAAGRPVEALEERETIELPAYLVGKNETYALRVRGDSMIEDHVLDNDLVIVEKREVPRDGEMVVALVRNSEATLKRFRREGRKIRLEPANPSYEPIVLDQEDVKIQGVVVGILRKFK